MHDYMPINSVRREKFHSNVHRNSTLGLIIERKSIRRLICKLHIKRQPNTCTHSAACSKNASDLEFWFVFVRRNGYGGRVLITYEKFLFFGSRFSSSASALSGFPRTAAGLPSAGPVNCPQKWNIYISYSGRWIAAFSTSLHTPLNLLNSANLPSKLAAALAFLLFQ